jgi:ornithine cyclodeaminase/alanine dehydrogenase-like protein (mu-crystallin family)
VGDWVAPGAHVNAVGAFRPEWRELDDALLAQAAIWTDSKDAALVESGDVIAAAARLVGEIGAVAAGTVRGRQAADEVTVFKSLGVAAEDVAAAELVWRRLAEGGGQPGEAG